MAQKSEILWGISQQPALRWRVEALVREYRWTTSSENPEEEIPLSQLCWAVASDAAVQETITAWLEAQVPGSLARGSYSEAISAIDDEDMKTVILAGLTRLATGE